MSRPPAATDTRPTDGAPEVVRVFGTGLLRTQVRRAAHGYEWIRTPGPLAPHPFVPTDGVAATLLGPLLADDTPVRVVLGEPVGGSRRYRALGAQSVAGDLLGGGGAEHAGCVRGLGDVLRRMHAVPGAAATHGLEVPRGLRRLRAWLDGEPGAGRAEPVRDEVHRLLGDERWTTLRTWCREATAADAVLCHGAPGLGSLVPGPRPDRGDVVLLTGEDLAAAPWQFDVGWVVGELVEVSWQLPATRATCSTLLDAFYDGYGEDLGGDWNRWAALRVALHLHDFSAYVATPESEATAYAGFLGFLVQAR